MATKAERFRYDAERSVGSVARQPPKKKAKKGAKAAATAKRAPSRGRKAVFAFEENSDTPPSRKSTRRSSHRQKAATSLTGRNLRSKAAPHNRHDAGRAGKSGGVR
jgi:hypothetical protein